MPRTLPSPGHIIDRQTAEIYSTMREFGAIWDQCERHPVAECTTCNAVFCMNELRHPPVGYYPGDPSIGLPLPQKDASAPPPRALDHGNRYAHRCPNCDNDLTALVRAHYEAHELARTQPQSSTPKPTA